MFDSIISRCSTVLLYRTHGRRRTSSSAFLRSIQLLCLGLAWADICMHVSSNNTEKCFQADLRRKFSFTVNKTTDIWSTKCCSAHSSLGRVLTVAHSAVTPLVQPRWIHNCCYHLQLKTTLSKNKSCTQLPETDDHTATSFTSIQVRCREIQSDDTQMFSVQLFCTHLAVFSKSYCCSCL